MGDWAALLGEFEIWISSAPGSRTDATASTIPSAGTALVDSGGVHCGTAHSRNVPYRIDTEPYVFRCPAHAISSAPTYVTVAQRGSPSRQLLVAELTVYRLPIPAPPVPPSPPPVPVLPPPPSAPPPPCPPSQPTPRAPPLASLTPVGIEDATLSSTYNAQIAANAIDDNLETIAASQLAAGSWLSLRLHSAAVIGYVALYNVQGQAGERYASLLGSFEVWTGGLAPGDTANGTRCAGASYRNPLGGIDNDPYVLQCEPAGSGWGSDGPFVTILQTGEPRHLLVAEVKLYLAHLPPFAPAPPSPPPPPGHPPLPPLPPGAPPPPPSVPGLRRVVEELNERFANGHPTDDWTRAGVLFHAFDAVDGYNGHLDLWNGCEGSRTWCFNLDRFSVSMLNARLPVYFNLYHSGVTGAPKAGFIVSTAAVAPDGIRCMFPMDAGTVGSGDGCPGPVCSGCLLHGTCGTYCHFQSGQLRLLLERHEGRHGTGGGCGQADCNYNEIIVDVRARDYVHAHTHVQNGVHIRHGRRRAHKESDLCPPINHRDLLCPPSGMQD